MNDSTPAASSEPSLIRDENGAIMVMGLLMILGLIGCMWFLLGLGATVSFRAHLQDAADSAAFSDAAINANAMNQLAGLNLQILGLVCIYLSISFLVTAAWAAALVVCIASLLTACKPAVQIYHEIYGARGYFAMAIRAAELFLVEDEMVIGSTAPSLASSSASQVAAAYTTRDAIVSGFAYGADNTASELGESEIDIKGNLIEGLGQTTDVPGRLLEAEGGKTLEGLKGKLGTNVTNLTGGLITGLGGALLDAASPKVGQRLGLPVEFEPVGNVCSHIVSFISGELTSVLGDSAKYLKYVLPAGMLFSSRVDETETFFQFYYCDDTPFTGSGELSSVFKDALHLLGATEREIFGGGDEASYWHAAGPTRMWKHSDHGGDGHHHKAEPKNGDDYLQFYGFANAPTYDDDDAVHKINLAAFRFGRTGEKPKPPTYFAQAEMFFACDDKWSTDACDDEGDDDTIDMAMYQMRWQARLVRFHAPTDTGVASDVSKTLDTASDVATTLNPVTQAISGSPQSISAGVEAAKDRIGDGSQPPARTYH